MTGRKKDTVKRDRIAELLRKGTPTSAIVERVGCHKDLVHRVRQAMRSSFDGAQENK